MYKFHQIGLITNGQFHPRSLTGIDPLIPSAAVGHRAANVPAQKSDTA